MKLNRIIHVLPALLMAPATFWAAHAVDKTRDVIAPVQTGSYAITFHVSAPSTVPDGATVVCKASFTPQAQSGSASASVDSVPGYAQVSGSSANCSVHLPIGFVARDARIPAALSYEIDAFTAESQVFKRTQQNIAVAYPETASANLHLNVNF